MRVALEDSRRVTGPNLVAPRPGALLDVRVDGTATGDDGTGDTVARVMEAWGARAREALDAVGWGDEDTFSRSHRDGASLVISAPIDALYAATEVNEWALAAATRDIEVEASGDLPEGNETPDEAFARLRHAIERESNPALLDLQAEAGRRRLLFLSDDDVASVGMGVGSASWPVDDLPAPADVPWDRLHDIPSVLVTGTNGKTTTVRFLAEMVMADGREPGFSSTDGVFVGRELTEPGDYSGPGGARAVLRAPAVEAAVLETARGGMLRRGLGTPRADGAVVTNVGVDHLGEYGLYGIEDIADAKLVVARAVEHGGRMVLNADDPVLAARGAPAAAELVWFSTRGLTERVAAHLAAGGEAVVALDGWFVRARGEERWPCLEISSAPATLDGAAVHNVANALAALALAPALGLDDEAAAGGLAALDPTADRLPGRTNVYRFGEATAIVDYVHNPHGMRALADVIERLGGRRRLVVLGQAGDRDDQSIRALARSVLDVRPDRVVVKEMRRYLRGRPAGVVPRLIREELASAAPGLDVVEAPDEMEAVRSALEWCAEGDVLLLSIQAERSRVLAWLEALRRSGWRPGRELPAPDADPVPETG